MALSYFRLIDGVGLPLGINIIGFISRYFQHLFKHHRRSAVYLVHVN